MEKVIRNGKVAVLYSPGYGAGWSTWIYSGHEGKEKALFCPEIVEWVLNGKKESETPDFQALLGDIYTGGAAKLVVSWVPLGTAFQVDEYDGAESIRIRDMEDWYLA